MPRKRKARKIASAVHNAVNEERRKRSLKTLDGHRPLNRAAERFARVVMDHGSLSHTADSRSSAAQRYKGYQTKGENLSKTRDQGRPPPEIAQEVVKSWLDSQDGHRAHMLNPTHRIDGTGVWIRSDTVVVAHVPAQGREQQISSSLWPF
jgi:uncharacterized protein YkwD